MNSSCHAVTNGVRHAPCHAVTNTVRNAEQTSSRPDPTRPGLSTASLLVGSLVANPALHTSVTRENDAMPHNDNEEEELHIACCRDDDLALCGAAAERREETRHDMPTQ